MSSEKPPDSLKQAPSLNTGTFGRATTYNDVTVLGSTMINGLNDRNDRNDSNDRYEQLNTSKTTSTHLKPRSSPSTAVHLVSGGAAGLVSAVTLQPLDLLKTRLQQHHAGGPASVTRELRKLARVSDLWRGVLPLTLRTSLGAGLYFTTLSQTRAYLATLKASGAPLASSVLPKLSHAENLATGFFVRALVGMVTMPITVVKTRFESSMYSYASMREIVSGIYGDGGQKSVGHFFKGTAATLARDCPYAGLYVLFYEGFKNEVVPGVLGVAMPLSASVTNSVSAILAALLATSITAPFDAIKTRMQLSAASTVSAVTRQLILEPGGVWNLFSGLSLRLARKAVSAGILWCLYEELLKYL